MLNETWHKNEDIGMVPNELDNYISKKVYEFKDHTKWMGGASKKWG